MITENDLLEAIAECQGQRNPNANTCIKLAAYYTILNNIQTADEKILAVAKNATANYSYTSSDGTEKNVEYYSDSEFSKLIGGKNAIKMWTIIDELMSTLAVINPKLYNDTMRKLNE